MIEPPFDNFPQDFNAPDFEMQMIRTGLVTGFAVLIVSTMSLPTKPIAERAERTKALIGKMIETFRWADFPKTMSLESAIESMVESLNENGMKREAEALREMIVEWPDSFE